MLTNPSFLNIDKNFIKNLIKNYTFDAETKLIHGIFIETQNCIDFLKYDSEETFKDLFEMFWNNPSVNVDYLAFEFSIPQNINIWTLLKSYLNNKYLEFLRTRWSFESTSAELLKKYGFPSTEYVYNLTKPLYYYAHNIVCNKCLLNDMYLLSLRQEFDSSEVISYNCAFCYNVPDFSIDASQARELLISRKRSKDSYDKYIIKLHEVLEFLRCTKCNGKLRLIGVDIDFDFSHKILCENCGERYSSNNIELLPVKLKLNP